MQGVPGRRPDRRGHAASPATAPGAVVDPAAGKVLSAKRWPRAAARRRPPSTTTAPSPSRLPDGGDPPRSATPPPTRPLSAWLDHDVALRRSRRRATASPSSCRPTPGDDTSPPVGVPRPARRPVRRPRRRPPAHDGQPAGRRRPAPRRRVGRAPLPAHRPRRRRRRRVRRGRLGRPSRSRLGAVVARRRSCRRCGAPCRPGRSPASPKDADIARTLNDHHDLNLGRLLQRHDAGSPSPSATPSRVAG